MSKSAKYAAALAAWDGLTRAVEKNGNGKQISANALYKLMARRGWRWDASAQSWELSIDANVSAVSVVVDANGQHMTMVRLGMATRDRLTYSDVMRVSTLLSSLGVTVKGVERVDMGTDTIRVLFDCQRASERVGLGTRVLVVVEVIDPDGGEQ